MYRFEKHALSQTLPWILTAVLGTTVAAAQETSDWLGLVANPELRSVIDEASEYAEWEELFLANNPGLKAAHARWLQAGERQNLAGSLPDPSLRGAVALAPVQTATGAQQAKLALSQGIPWPGTLKAQTAGQKYMADAAFYDLVDQAALGIRDLKKLYADLYLNQQEYILLNDNLELLKAWESVLLIRYRGSTVNQPALVQTQLEVIRHENQLQSVMAEQDRLLERFAARLQLDADAVKVHIGSIQFVNAHTEVVTVPESPRVLRAAAQLEASRFEQNVARLNSRPDLMFGVEWSMVNQRPSGGTLAPGSGADAVALTAGLSLPIFRSKNKAERAIADFRKSERQSALLGIERQIAASIQEALILQHDAFRRRDVLERQILPKAEEALSVQERSFASDATDYAELIEALKQLHDIRFEIAQAHSQIWTINAELVYLKGDLR